MKLQDKLAGWVKTGKGAIIFIHWESKVKNSLIIFKVFSFLQRQHEGWHCGQML